MAIFHGPAADFPPRPTRWNRSSRSRQSSKPPRALAGRRERTARGSRITLPAEPARLQPAGEATEHDRPATDLLTSRGRAPRPGAGQRRDHAGASDSADVSALPGNVSGRSYGMVQAILFPTRIYGGSTCRLPSLRIPVLPANTGFGADQVAGADGRPVSDAAGHHAGGHRGRRPPHASPASCSRPMPAPGGRGGRVCWPICTTGG